VLGTDLTERAQKNKKMAYQKLQVSRVSAVVNSDTVDIPYVGDPSSVWPCILYSGTGGDIRVMTAGGDDVLFVGVPAGSFMPVQVIRVFATDTVPTDILACW
jgi:hypothetical protein